MSREKISKWALSPEELAGVAKRHRESMKYNAMPIVPIRLTPVSDDDLVARLELLADTLIRKHGDQKAERLFIGAFRAAQTKYNE